jgi:voltage-gated potassium channel
MTVITLSTVGFGEIQPLHTTGRIFVIILIVFGVASATFAASTLGQIILEGQIRRLMGRRKMESKIKKLKDHYIIAGFVRVGRQVAEEYVQRNVPFIIIEKDEEALSILNMSGYNYIDGEATEDEVLISAKIKQAKVLVSTLPSEADNVYISLTARHMNPELHIIARADNPGGERKLKRAGADSVVSPHILGGMRMAMSSLRPNVVDFMQMTSLGEEGLGVEEISVPVGCRFAGKSLMESGIKAEYGVTVVGIKKPNQKMQINPPPDANILENDILVLVGSIDELERLTREMSNNS